MSHRLATLLAEAARDRYPPPDGEVEVVGPPPGRAQAVVAFTAHTVIATALDEAQVRPLIPPGDLAAPLHPTTLVALGHLLGVAPRNLELALVSTGPGEAGVALRPEDNGAGRQLGERQYRHNVTVWTDEERRGRVTVGQGLAGRWEVSLEIDLAHRGQALATRLLLAVRHLLPRDVPLWAQVSPANPASLRTFLAAGFTPVAAEVLFVRA